MNKKGRMRLVAIIISILVVSMITLGLVEYITDLKENYGTTADLSKLDGTIERLERHQNLSANLSGVVTDFTLEESGSAILIPYKFFQVGWKATKLIFNAWGTTETMIVEVGEGISEDGGIPLPAWFIPTLISIFVITLVIILVYAFFKWRFES